MTIRVDSQKLAAVCQRYGVARLDVFGSVARGEATPDSDVDLLYTMLPGSQLGWEVVDLATELEALMGRPVDLIAHHALHERIRPAAELEARQLYAAS